MTFWIITAGLAIAVAGLLGLALRVPAATTKEVADYDLRVYRDQLREVERDLARGVLAEADAERARTEVSRRILAADAARTGGTGDLPGRHSRTLVALLLGLAIVAASFALYLQLGAPGYGDLGLKDRIAAAETLHRERPNQQQAEASLPPYEVPGEASPDYIALVEKLRDTVTQRPDDIQGSVLLAQNEANLGNFAAAARAQGNVVRLKGADASVEDLSSYAELMVLAAGGYVSPEAETVLRAVLSQDETNAPARYYLGLMMAQTGRPDTAFRVWDRLLREGPRDAPWIEPILSQIEELARYAGVNYQLPDIGGDLRGPDAAAVAAAGEMTASERMEMIESMVGGLSQRLATEGGTVPEWVQLIGALGVLGRVDDARAIVDNALEVFAGDETALDQIRGAAERVGLGE